MVRESNPKEFGVALFFLPHFCFCAGGRGLRQDGMKLQKGICSFLALQVVTVLPASNPFSPGCLLWAWAVPLGPGYVRRKEEKCGNGVGGESGDQEEDRPQVPPPRGGTCSRLGCLLVPCACFLQDVGCTVQFAPVPTQSWWGLSAAWLRYRLSPPYVTDRPLNKVPCWAPGDA